MDPVRLATRLHSVFDAQPSRLLALRIRHAQGLVWSLSGAVLRLAVAGTEQSFALSDRTLLALKAILEQSGFDVPFIAESVQHLSAEILLDGVGDQSLSNGDHLYAWTSPLTALLHAQEGALGRARASIPDALGQLILTSARNEFLALHGEHYGIARLLGQDDTEYARHILAEVRRPRSNAYAIRANIRRRLGVDVGVDEPWRYMARFSDAALSTDKRFYHGARWSPHIIQLISPDPIDWESAQALAQADRAAGVLLLDPAWQPLARLLEDQLNGDATLLRTDHFSGFTRGIWEPIWNYSRLGEHDILRDFAIAWSNLHTGFSAADTQGMDLWNGVTHYCIGWGTLSEDKPIGHEDTAWAGGWYRDVTGDGRTLSGDFNASDYVVTDLYHGICDWSIEALGLEAACDGLSPQPVLRHDRHTLETDWQGYAQQGRTWASTDGWSGLSWAYVPLRFTIATWTRDCEQFADGATPIFSDSGLLSDYLDGLECADVQHVPPTWIRVGEQIAFNQTPVLSVSGALSDYLSGLDAQQGEAPSWRLLSEQWGETPIFSVDGALSDYIDGMDRAVIQHYPPSWACRQRADGTTPTWSDTGALSGYIDGITCGAVPAVS